MLQFECCGMTKINASISDINTREYHVASVGLAEKCNKETADDLPNVGAMLARTDQHCANIR